MATGGGQRSKAETLADTMNISLDKYEQELIGICGGQRSFEVNTGQTHFTQSVDVSIGIFKSGIFVTTVNSCRKSYMCQ